MVKISGHISERVNVIYVIYNRNSILCMVTNIYPKTEILLKNIDAFRSERLALFTVPCILNNQKDTKKKALKRMKGKNLKAQASKQTEASC